MKNAKVHSSCMKSFKTVKDANISKKEIITSRGALHNVHVIRNLPNILRNNTTKTSRNRKQLNTIDISLISNTEDGNTSSDLNTTLTSIDLEMEANCNKTSSPKSYHQRKQVHNPLNIQYDIPDSRSNNKNKNILPIIGQLNALRISPNREKNASTKRKYNNKQKKHSLNKKLKKVTAYKSGSKMQMSDKKLDTLATISDVNMNSIVQNANNFLENDILIQPVYNPNFPNVNVNDLNDIAIKSNEPSKISYHNNNIYNIEKKCDVNLNHVISCKPIEFDTMQHKAIQRDFTSSEFPITENNLQEELIDRDIDSNFLYGSKILYSCSCANCMSHDKDIIFYEDPNSTTSTSSDNTEAEFFTCDLYTNIYDFYINNYSHIFDDNLMGFETNLYCEEFDENNIMKENTYTDIKSTTEELIKNNTNLSMNQNEQSCYGIQDYLGAYPTELATYPNGVRMENVRVFNDMDISNYLNPENFSMKESKIIPQDEAVIQTVTSTNVPVSNSNCQTPENKKGK